MRELFRFVALSGWVSVVPGTKVTFEKQEPVMFCLVSSSCGDGVTCFSLDAARHSDPCS